MSKEKLISLPDYMEEGSRGDMAVAVNIFLAGAAEGLVKQSHGFIVDEIYGPVAAARMRAFQRNEGIAADGGCGPETRETMKKFRFDFERVAGLLKGTTIFVQPDGSAIPWSLAMVHAEQFAHGLPT